MRSFTEQNPAVAAPNKVLTARAVAWAVEQVRREQDPSRFDGVRVLGVDEHLWHHVSTKPVAQRWARPEGADGNGRAHPRRYGARTGGAARPGTGPVLEGIRRLNQGTGPAVTRRREDRRAGPIRRRVQQGTLGHRGRKGDPLYGIRNIFRAGRERLTDKQRSRLETAFTQREEHIEVEVAWHAAQQLRHACLAEGRNIAERIRDSFPECPIPEIARLGRTLTQWRDAFLAYWATGRSSNGGTKAINGLIELHRRIARGFTKYDNYRLRVLLIAGGLDPVTPT